MHKFTTYAITVRPRAGISDEHIKILLKWIKRNCQYYYIISEKTGDERHIHSALYLKSPKTRSNVVQCMLQVYKELDRDEKAVLGKGVKILYSNSFLTEYMNKGDDTVVIERNLPELDILDNFYPPKPISKPMQRRLYMHATMEQYETLWRTHVSSLIECNTATARDFLFNMQYNERVIGLLDERKLMQHARWFTRWFHRSEFCPTSFLPPFENEEGPGVHGTTRRI